jgi:hypothetical protein
MIRWLVAVVLGLAAAVPGRMAAAQAMVAAPPGATIPAVRPLVVVIQSGLGTAGGDELRNALAQRFALEVATVRNADLKNQPPQAMLTLAIDEQGELNAIYWDDTGSFDVFSAPAPKDAAALNTAALTLATALVQRHVDTLRGGGQTARKLSPQDVDLMQRAALYSMLVRRGSVGRLAVQLRPEDF